MNHRRTEGFITVDTQPAHFPLSPSATSTPFFPKTTSTPTSTSDFLYTTTSSTPSGLSSSVGSSSIGPGGKRKKNFKLGTKIDTWWSAVRTSFSANTEDEKDRIARRNSSLRSTSTTNSVVSRDLPAAPSRTSSQFLRSETPGEQTTPLRNVASAQDLTTIRRPSATGSIGSTAVHSFVPAGALAPAARTHTKRTLPLQPTLRPTTSSGSDADSELGVAKLESRRRNPQLSLNLGPAFNNMIQPLPKSITRLDSSSPLALSPENTDISSASTGPQFFAPTTSTSMPPPSSFKSHQPLGISSATPGLTPGHTPMWDKTPGLVPTSSSHHHRGITSEIGSKALQDIKAAATSSFSMNTVRQHIKLRLKTAKENCDKELKKIVQGITTHVEVELQKEAVTTPGAFDEGRFGDLVGDIDGPYGPYSFDVDSESEALADVDAGEEAIQTDSDGGTSRPPSRNRRASRPSGSGGGSSPNLSAPVESGRRHSVSTRRAGSPRLAVRKRQLTSASRHPDFGTYSFGDKSKSPSESANSSRSNSRSRSPMPPPLQPTPPLQALRNVSSGSRSPAYQNASTADLVSGGGLAQSAFIVLLQEIITIATEVLDTPISILTAQSGSCAEYIQRVQVIGKAWDDNPELPCRGWYVQLLLAVAGLSRVVEWWEAERGFWTFDDGDEEDAEPILFVAKPIEEDLVEIRSPGQSIAPLPPQDSPNLIQKYSPLGIDLGLEGNEQATFSQLLDVGPIAETEENTKRDADDLREAVDQVRSQTLLMELSLDGQLFQYLSSAWLDLVG